MAKKVNVGDSIDLGTVGFVRLPDGAVVTSGPEYIVRHEGLHVAFGNEEVEYDAVDSSNKASEPTKAGDAKAPKPNKPSD